MNNEDICNLDKLPKYFAEVGQKRVCVIGCGAVGSIVVELLVKIGIKKLYLIDFDNFEKENIYKSSSIYDIECDAGKNKAIVLALVYWHPLMSSYWPWIIMQQRFM